MSRLSLHTVEKRYGERIALRGVSLECAEGEFVALLGAPGAGKSTTLKLVAGIEAPTAGDIRLGDRSVTDLPPERRDVAMAFESYALYPHRTVRGNLEFPLRAPGRAQSREDRAAAVEEVARLLEISELLDRPPSQLSGGQRQRVSLGRALVRRCNVALLDEPIAHLDARLRFDLRAELKRFQRRRGVTTLYATPDFGEAAAIADRIAVLVAGELHQVGTPTEVFDRPADVEVALLAGDPKMNLFTVSTIDGGAAAVIGGEASAVLRGLPRGTHRLGIRPSDVRAERAPIPGALPGAVYVTEPMGDAQVVRVALGSHIVNVSLATASGFTIGQRVWLVPDWSRAHLFDTAGRRLERPEGR